MFTVAFISQKGNQGKTTAAYGVAVAAAKVGLNVVYLDTDPQATATKLEGRHKRENPIVIPMPISLLDREWIKARDAGADWFLIDCPGMNADMSVVAAKKADLVLVLTSADPIVMETLPAVRNMIRMADDPLAFVVYNFIHPAGSKIAENLKDATPEFCGLPACPVHLTRRNTHVDASADGLVAAEIEPGGESAAEIERLYLFVSSHVNMSGRLQHEQRG